MSQQQDWPMPTMLTMSQVATRSGVSPSALRFYEDRGLIAAHRTPGNRRTYRRNVLRRLAVIRTAQAVGLSLTQIRAALAPFPVEAQLNAEQWHQLATGWRGDLNLRIQALTELRDGIEGCIGCGCLSMTACPLTNPDDRLAQEGPGPRALPATTQLTKADSGHHSAD